MTRRVARAALAYAAVGARARVCEVTIQVDGAGVGLAFADDAELDAAVRGFVARFALPLDQMGCADDDCAVEYIKAHARLNAACDAAPMATPRRPPLGKQWAYAALVQLWVALTPDDPGPSAGAVGVLFQIWATHAFAGAEKAGLGRDAWVRTGGALRAALSMPAHAAPLAPALMPRGLGVLTRGAVLFELGLGPLLLVRRRAVGAALVLFHGVNLWALAIFESSSPWRARRSCSPPPPPRGENGRRDGRVQASLAALLVYANARVLCASCDATLKSSAESACAGPRRWRSPATADGYDAEVRPDGEIRATFHFTWRGAQRSFAVAVPGGRAWSAAPPRDAGAACDDAGVPAADCDATLKPHVLAALRDLARPASVSRVDLCKPDDTVGDVEAFVAASVSVAKITTLDCATDEVRNEDVDLPRPVHM
ncbi:hypothetical protein JL722_10837 [Aureococcus anophagefferens]|nr:hypothetical protein JL722_10837 [Aureococcus anophagefferens]